MGAPNQKLLIGDENNPDYIFASRTADGDNTIISIEGLMSCAIGGENLAIDTVSAKIHHKFYEPEIINPADTIEVHDGIETADSKILTTKAGVNLLYSLGSNRPAFLYDNEKLVGKFYIDSVEREEKDIYNIKLYSLVGILDKQYSYGGLFVNVKFKDALEEVLDPQLVPPYEEVEYIYSNGTQAINLNYRDFGNDYEITVAFTNLTGIEKCIIGSSYQAIYVSSNTIKRVWDGGYCQDTYNFIEDRKYIFHVYKNRVIITDTVTGTRGTYCSGDSPSSEFVGNSIYIFANNVNDNPADMCSAKLYELDLYPLHLLPYRCNVDNTGVMYMDPNEYHGDYQTALGFLKSITAYSLLAYPEYVPAEHDLTGIEIIYGDGIADVIVNGWLAMDTKRNNLYKLLLASGVNLIKNEEGKLVFSQLTDSEYSEIEDADIYDEGSTIYSGGCSTAVVTEHVYYRNGSYSNSQPVTLFDNTKESGVAESLPINFQSAPIIVDTLQVTGSIVIEKANANYAIVSGKGTLTGIPYQHVTHNVTMSSENSTNLESREASISDNYLVNISNSNRVLERLWNYKNVLTTVKSMFVYNGERCGQYVLAKTRFGESIYGFISKFNFYASAKDKVEAEILVGYTPVPISNNYTAYVVLTGSGVWSVPDGVSKIRVILIGGGSGGTAGQNGQEGGEGADDHYDRTKADSVLGGEGGEPGEGGSPAYVQDVEIDDPASQYSYTCGTGGNGGTSRYSPSAGTHTTFGTYSTEPFKGGFIPDHGIPNPFTGEIYALAGPNDGIAGGHGGPYIVSETSYYTTKSRNGQDVAYNGVIYKGGTGHAGSGPNTDARPGEYNYGGGAAAGRNGWGGGPGKNASPPYEDPVDNIGTYPQISSERTGGSGASAIDREAQTRFGWGGAAGHGGGGGGTAGYYYEYQGGVARDFSGTPGRGGYGGSGGKGGPGCIIVCY